MKIIVWFRDDLRASDNPALHAAAADGDVIPVYILPDNDGKQARPLGGASRWWLHHSLKALREDLSALILRQGDPAKEIEKLMRETGAGAVYWNRRYHPADVTFDQNLMATLKSKGTQVKSFKANLLHEPWEVKNQQQQPYKVFSAYWRAARQLPILPALSKPNLSVSANGVASDRLLDWCLTPQKPNWAVGWETRWCPGEAGAKQRLLAFLEHDIDGYAANRDRPDLNATSLLSPHLRFGEISPRQIYHQLTDKLDRAPNTARDLEKFQQELTWREFSYSLDFHFPDLATKNWKPAFDAYPWQEDAALLAAWQQGRTGYPLVDAGMRELWQTGYMHNRVRMITASFLVKHLRHPWQVGEQWFWDTLVDADPANNAASWQWVAGSGADAAPYFRIFNPMTQAQKFDPDGTYIRKWCPELSQLETKYFGAPFAAPAASLARAGITIGKDYPFPIVDHKAARDAALAGYTLVKQANETQ